MPAGKSLSTSAPVISPSILSRKGAKKTSLVPQEVRNLLNRGQIESVNLCEWLVVDHAELARATFPELECEDMLQSVLSHLETLEAPTAMKRAKLVGAKLSDRWSSAQEFHRSLCRFQSHPSDTVRCWACMMIGARSSATIADQLSTVKPFAADSNMGVREMAWMAVRPKIACHLEVAVELLLPWTNDTEATIRRFVSEATRPRGVWCQHLEALKTDPSRGLILLEPLRADPSKYVRDSVANWLNDASKSHPQFVLETAERWLRESSARETRQILQRALRTLKKLENPQAIRLLRDH